MQSTTRISKPVMTVNLIFFSGNARGLHALSFFTGGFSKWARSTWRWLSRLGKRGTSTCPDSASRSLSTRTTSKPSSITSASGRPSCPSRKRPCFGSRPSSLDFRVTLNCPSVFWAASRSRWSRQRTSTTRTTKSFCNCRPGKSKRHGELLLPTKWSFDLASVNMFWTSYPFDNVSTK